MGLETRIIATLICDDCKKVEDFDDHDETNADFVANVVRDMYSRESRDDGDWFVGVAGRVVCGSCYIKFQNKCKHVVETSTIVPTTQEDGSTFVEAKCAICDLLSVATTIKWIGGNAA